MSVWVILLLAVLVVLVFSGGRGGGRMRMTGAPDVPWEDEDEAAQRKADKQGSG